MTVISDTTVVASSNVNNKYTPPHMIKQCNTNQYNNKQIHGNNNQTATNTDFHAHNNYNNKNNHINNNDNNNAYIQEFDNKSIIHNNNQYNNNNNHNNHISNKDYVYKFKALPELHNTDISNNIIWPIYNPVILDRTKPDYKYNKHALYNYVKPYNRNIDQEHKNVIYYEDQYIVILYDGIPKSTIHLLIVPKTNLHSLDDINTLQHILLLQYIHNIGCCIIQYLKTTIQYKHLQYDLGYHRIPSQYLLHCHLISTDYIHNNINKVSIWNKFNTKFFVNSKQLIQQLHNITNDNIQQTILDYIGSENHAKNIRHRKTVYCNRIGCNSSFNNIDDIKQHIINCTNSLPSGVQY